MSDQNENKTYGPNPEVAATSHIGSMEEYERLYRLSLDDPETFWGKQAENISWFHPPRMVFDHDYENVDFSWYLGGRLNACFNCVDRHMEDKGDQDAIIWVKDEPGEYEHITYRQLKHEVARVANVLKAHGVRKGDRIAIYMPMIPELAYTMLACARLGAIHSIIFGGFSADAIRDRVLDAQCKVVVTANEGLRGSKKIKLKETVDKAVDGLDMVETVLVARRTDSETKMKPGRDFWLDEECRKQRSTCTVEWMGSEDPLFILYTSGSTGQPKGVMHSTGRLHGLRGDDPQDGLQLPAEGHLLLRRGHRLDHRAQLHHLRTAGQRGDHGDVRVDPDLSRRRPLLADRGRPEGEHLLHRAHGDPGHRPRRRQVPGKLLAGFAQGPRHRRRAHQPRNLAVVPGEGRQEPVLHRRYLVADRNRRDHDHAAARSHPLETGVGHAAVLRRQAACWWTRRARSSKATAWRATCASKRPGRARRAPCGAITIASTRPTSRSTRACISPATAAGATRTATTGSPVVSTT